jgi:hypothetical protein
MAGVGSLMGDMPGQLIRSCGLVAGAEARWGGDHDPGRLGADADQEQPLGVNAAHRAPDPRTRLPGSD